MNRFHGQPNKKECLPIPRCLLICILSLLDTNDPRDANLYGAFGIAHAGSLRAGELTWTANNRIYDHTEFTQWNLTSTSVQFEEDWLLLTLPSSKADPFSKRSDDQTVGIQQRRLPSHGHAAPLRTLPKLDPTRLSVHLPPKRWPRKGSIHTRIRSPAHAGSTGKTWSQGSILGTLIPKGICNLGQGSGAAR